MWSRLAFFLGKPGEAGALGKFDSAFGSVCRTRLRLFATRLTIPFNNN
jgi:hypothetical protein